MNAAVANLAPNIAPDPILECLENQIDWYDRYENKSISNMHWFKRIKIMEIVSAAVIPLPRRIPCPARYHHNRRSQRTNYCV
jgi:hypothetical protein